LTASLAEDLRTSPGPALANVGRSLAQDELNLLPSMPLAPSLALFGQSRRAWILTVLNIYVLPALLLGLWAVWRWGERPDNDWNQGVSALVWVATIFLFAPLWEPLALGYLDIGGLVLIFAALGLALGEVPEQRREALLRALAVGVMVAVLLIFRRWYAFWSVSFCIVVALGTLIAVLRARKTGHSPVETLRRPIFIGAGVIGTLALLVGPRLATMAGTDYGDRFIHYKIHSSVWAELWALVGQFGLLPLGVAVAGALVLLRSEKTRWFAAGLIMQLVVIAALFRRVQDPTPQHWYLLLPGLMVLTAGGLTAWLSSAEPAARRSGVAVVLVAGLLVTSQVFGWVSVAPSPLMPTVRVTPKARGDLAEFERMMAWLDGRVEMGAEWVYVLAATGAVSDSSLGFSNFSLGTRFRSPGHVLMTAQVDRRDGFPDGLLLADVVVVPSPVAVRGKGETQRVVAVPAQDFLEGGGVAEAFVRLDEVFTFDDGVTAIVFERLRSNTTAEIQAFSDQLKVYYPDRPEV
ncbi:MAG: hypothetical protein ABFS37_16805, partial [Acidobacteriota bacterium]